jgi:predicted permease
MSAELWTDLRTAIRGLRRSPVFFVTAVMTLAIGLTVCVAVFSVINGLLLRPSPIGDPDGVVAISSTGQLRILQQEPLSFPDVMDISRRAPAFEAVVAHRRMPATLGTGLEVRVALGETVTPNYFQALRIGLRLGRGFTLDDDVGRVVVLSHSMWQQRYGGNASAIGSSIEVSGSARTIVGIASDGFTGVFRGIAPEFWIPADSIALERSESRSNVAWFVHGRLRPGIGVAAASAQLDAIATQIASDYPREAAGRRFSLTPLSEASAHPSVPTGTLAAGSAAVLGIAGLLLMVACSNVAHLMLARSQHRSRELAIRSAMGCSRWRLARLLAVEGLVLSGAGGLIATMLTIWANRYLSTVQLPIMIRVDLGLRLDPIVIVFMALAVLLSTTMFALGPALRASRVDVVQVLNQEGSRGSTGGHRRSWTLAGQAAICMILLIFGGLTTRSLQRASSIDPGFAVDGVRVATVSPILAGLSRERAGLYFTRASEDLRRLPDVDSVSWVQPVPLSLNVRITRLRMPDAAGASLQELPLTDAAIVWPGYFGTMAIPIREGREFTDADGASASPVAIVSEGFARAHWASESPLGRSIAVGFPEPSSVEIIGVVADIKSRTLGDEARAMVYTAGAQDPMGWQGATAVIRLRPGSTGGLLAIAETLRATDPTVPVFDVQSLSTRMGGVLLLPQYAAAVFGGIGLIALALVSVGLGGVVAYWVSQRSREIGLRLALGGNRQRILWLVLSQSVWPAAVGIVIGSALALVGARALTAVLYGISASDPLTFLATAAVVALVAAAAALPPALRAIRLDPAATLRQD